MTYFYNLGTQLVNSRILFKFTHSYILKLIVYLIEAVLQLERFFAVEIFSAENDLPLDTLCGFLHPGFSPERATQRDFSWPHTLNCHPFSFLSTLLYFSSLIYHYLRLDDLFLIGFCLPIMPAFERSDILSYTLLNPYCLKKLFAQTWQWKNICCMDRFHVHNWKWIVQKKTKYRFRTIWGIIIFINSFAMRIVEIIFDF